MALLDDLLIEDSFDLVIGGRNFTVTPMTIGQAARLGRWVGENFRSPLENCSADLEKITDAVDREKAFDVVISLYESWPPEYGSGEASSRLFHTTKGRAEIFREALRDKHPEISDSDEACWKLARETSLGDFEKLLLAFHGKKSDPKADARAGALAPSLDQIGAILLANSLSRAIELAKSDH